MTYEIRILSLVEEDFKDLKASLKKIDYVEVGLREDHIGVGVKKILEVEKK